MYFPRTWSVHVTSSHDFEIQSHSIVYKVTDHKPTAELIIVDDDKDDDDDDDEEEDVNLDVACLDADAKVYDGINRCTVEKLLLLQTEIQHAAAATTVCCADFDMFR